MNEKLGIFSLTTEYKTNPLGSDTVKPRLSWKIGAADENIVQTAYRIQVAASAGELEKEENLLWDSGRVESAQSIHVEYAGAE